MPTPLTCVGECLCCVVCHLGGVAACESLLGLGAEVACSSSQLPYLVHPVDGDVDRGRLRVRRAQALVQPEGGAAEAGDEGAEKVHALFCCLE